MIVFNGKRFLKAAFDNEKEIEDTVQRYAKDLFGSTIIYLSQGRIQTPGGAATVPDAIVIDVEARRWYLVEAERAVHGTWHHIAPQVSKQLAALSSQETRAKLLRLALDVVKEDEDTREALDDLGIDAYEVHGLIHGILAREPIVAIPIDAIPADLQEWARTLRHKVDIWLIEKFVSEHDENAVLYSLPDENVPTVMTVDTPSGGSVVRSTGSQPLRELIEADPSLEGMSVYLEYGLRGRNKQKFEGILQNDGIEFEGRTYSLSAAAVRCINIAGSDRQTANGWIMWKTADGEVFDSLYKRVVASGNDN